ncbi:hypothetical protein GCM10009624_05270 [Gordonia sinesedis]
MTMNDEWRSLPAELLGGVAADRVGEVGINELIGSLDGSGAGQSYLAWHQYQVATVLYERLVEPHEDTDHTVVDSFADVAARIAVSQATSQYLAERLLTEAMVLRDRLPAVSRALRDGVIRPWQVKEIISRTDLIDGHDRAHMVDTEIADLLRNRRGAWSKTQLRDMVDRVVFRHDADAVRERREEALRNRGMWTSPKDDGTTEIGATMAAENVRIAAAAVTALAGSVCQHDPRRKPARASDAMFALLTGTPFECQCGRDDCPAQIPEPGVIPPVSASIVLHVVCDESTINGTADHPGYLDGHGVISPEHVRDIASRADCRIKPLVPKQGSEPPVTASGDQVSECPSPDGRTADPRSEEAAPAVRVADERSEKATPGVRVADERSEEAAPGVRVADERSEEAYRDRRPDNGSDPASSSTSPESAVGAVISIRPPLALRPTQPPGNTARHVVRPTQPPGNTARHVVGPAPPPGPPVPPEPPPLPPLRASLPSDPYRPTVALSTYVHIRDGYCVVPGCTKPAWSCDLDHVTEYDHENPTAGGQTCPEVLNDKCRFHHILKTHGGWLDDQYRDADGRLRTVFITPEGLTIDGNPETLEDLFPGLRRIRFQVNPAQPRQLDIDADEPRRARTRLANKLSRRRAERARNRRRREAADAEQCPRDRAAGNPDDPPF